MKKTTNLVALSAILLGALSPTSSVFAETLVTNNSVETQAAPQNTIASPNIDWNSVWQKYNKNMQTAFMDGMFTGTGKLIDYTMRITPSSLEGDTVPKINLTGLALAFNSSPHHVEDATIKNLTTNTEVVVPGNNIVVQAATATIPLSFNDMGALDTISVSAQTGWNGPTLAPPTPTLIFEKKETMLTRVYYMDASTGEELPGTSFETLGSGMTEGDSVTAIAKDLTANGWDYSGDYTLATPTSSTDGSGNTTSTVLQSGDVNNTSTTTGRQAIVFWYNKIDKTAINVHDSQIYAGDTWNAEDNFDNATATDGTALDYASFISAGGTVDESQLNTNTPGVYPVTYTLNGVTSTANITVIENKTTVTVHDSSIYVGDNWTAQDNFDSAIDKDGNPVDFSQVTVDDSKVDTSKVGTYDVTYTYDGVTSTAKITVKDKQTPAPKPDKPSDNGKSEKPKTDTKNADTKKDNSNKSVLPKTGETSGMIFSIIGILILGLISTALLFKKKKFND